MSELYIPPNSVTLDKLDIQQIRLGIQGPPNTGKTWGALTFPNITVADFNRGLGAHRGRSDVNQLAFYDGDFIGKIYAADPFNKREAYATWLETIGLNLTKNQTLVTDSSTDLEDIFHKWEEMHPVVTGGGKYNEFTEWANKLKYFGRIMEDLKALKCHVIWIMHETVDRDKKGELNGKVRPLLSGQFGDKIAGHFTDWVRAHTCDKPNTDEEITDNGLAMWGMKTKAEFKAMCNTFPGHTLYYWQLESDNVFNAKVSSLVGFPRYIPANYESFIKYLRK